MGVLSRIFAPKTLLVLLVTTVLFFQSGRTQDPNGVTIRDARHFSTVLGETRNYRIFLPPGYDDHETKRYPVIYFCHGWSQRYFGASSPYADYDTGNENGGDNIASFVSKNDVIVVKLDGYNRSPGEQYYVRPWNVTPVETYRQFPLYFPELVEHVDTHYRTMADREHRGISGLSMGGFMTFWIGGKYPHLLSAAGNFCGSPEFTVGPKDFPVEYRHLDMYKNYGGMNLRLNYGDKDFIRGYHEDMNRLWPQIMDNYEYKIYDAAHSTCGMGEMFAFMLTTFENPPARPASWNHIDVYPEFSVWDYVVQTDRTVPGFTILENVDARGFRSSVREFLPDGAWLSFVNVSIRTPPVYEKNQLYTINDIDLKTSKATERTIRSDGMGRLLITINGDTHEVGINRNGDKPNLALVDVSVQGARWATNGKEVKLAIKLLNKGSSPARNVRATLSATRPGARITKSGTSFGDIGSNEIKSGNSTVAFIVSADSIEIQKFQLTLSDGGKNESVQFFEIPLKKALPEIKDFTIADGKVFTVAKAGTGSDTLELGKGNGDGVANPGESIVILVRDQNKWWRTDLSGADPNINPFGINVRKSDNWASMDHVGGSAKYDIPLIASTTPENYPVEFVAEYWLPEYPLHIIKQGIVKFSVKGRDTTAPEIGHMQVTGDNVFQVRILDGSKTTRVKATLIAEGDDKKKVETSLTDDGRNGDRAENDLVFSQKIPRQVFGIFRATIEAEDSFGNKTVKESVERFVLH